MVMTTLGLKEIRDSSLDAFDLETQMGLGTGTTAFAETQTALVAELTKYALDTIAQDNSAGTYTFEYRLPIGSQTGQVLAELGIFNASNVMSFREVFETAVTPTADTEFRFKMVVTVTATEVS